MFPVLGGRENLALWQALVFVLACGACQCAKCGLAEKLKMCGGKNKKYRRVGKVCRLILCLVNISFLSCLFTMVYSSVFSRFRLFFTLAGNEKMYASIFSRPLWQRISVEVYIVLCLCCCAFTFQDCDNSSCKNSPSQIPSPAIMCNSRAMHHRLNIYGYMVMSVMVSGSLAR